MPGMITVPAPMLAHRSQAYADLGVSEGSLSIVERMAWEVLGFDERLAVGRRLGGRAADGVLAAGAYEVRGQGALRCIEAGSPYVA